MYVKFCVKESENNETKMTLICARLKKVVSLAVIIITGLTFVVVRTYRVANLASTRADLLMKQNAKIREELRINRVSFLGEHLKTFFS